MSSIEGICDWCNNRSSLTRHEYVDGKCHHSCEECNDLARIDVSLFNTDEIALRNKLAEGF